MYTGCTQQGFARAPTKRQDSANHLHVVLAVDVTDDAHELLSSRAAEPVEPACIITQSSDQLARPTRNTRARHDDMAVPDTPLLN